jgi:hypothetical protein
MSDEFQSPIYPTALEAPPPPPPADGPVVQFYKDVVGSLTEPRKFFNERYPKISFVYALTFGVVVNWIADFLSWLTRMIRHETLLDGLLKMRDRLQELPGWKDLPPSIWAQQAPDHTSMFPAWMAEVFSVALSPFNSLFRIFISGLVIWLGVYFLVPREQTYPARDSYEVKNVIKIIALTSAPSLISSILGFLPFGLGSTFGWLYAFVLLIFALTIRFQISGLRAFAIVIFPGIILSVAGTCLIATFGALFFGMIAALFSFH